MISVAAAASYLLKARSLVAIVPGADGEVVPLSANWGHKHLKNKVMPTSPDLLSMRIL